MRLNVLGKTSFPLMIHAGDAKRSFSQISVRCYKINRNRPSAGSGINDNLGWYGTACLQGINIIRRAE